MLERILVPLDGSPLAESILAQVKRILFRRDSEVILIRAIGPPDFFAGSVATSLAHDEADARTYLRRLETALSDSGARIRTQVAEGSPADVILGTAEREHCSLVAMTTHGRTGFSRWTFGSVAEKVLRASPIPLLMTRSFVPVSSGQLHPTPSKELGFGKILVPLEIGKTSLEVVPHVTEMARLFGAKVLLLNVCGNKVACDVPVVEMTQAFEALRTAEVAVEPIMRQGDAAREILEVSRDGSVDLIAMTTHARMGPSRWALGSVTEKVLRHSTCPLLAVRGSRS